MSSDPNPVTPPLPPDVAEVSSAAPAAGVPGSIPSTPDDRTMAMLCHLGGILTAFIVPLIIWLIKKDQSKFVDDQGKEALNFQITILIGYLIAALPSCFLMGVPSLAVWIIAVVLGIMGAVAANKGEVYRYPLNIRFIK
jgi:uncharacterized Tic20 family protein